MKTIKNKILLSGSILSAVLLVGSMSANATQATNDINVAPTERSITREPAQIGAFANLDSFENDGFNGGVKAAATLYTGNWDTVKNQTSEYSDTGSVYVDPLTTMYEESDIIISAGFQVANAITGIPGEFDGVFTNRDGTDTSLANSSDKAFVLLDDTVLASTYTNAASISYAAEGAGFLAGIGAAVYTEYDAIANAKENANIVMWGGMAFPTVYDFLSGFAQAIDYVNTTYASVEDYKEITLWSGGKIAGEKISEENTMGTSTNSDTWYTFGFDASADTLPGKSAQIKTQNAIDAGASIVFPVAGGNTTVAEKTLMDATDSTTKLVGVDADATMSSVNDDLYIGTAAKNLEEGGALGLWSMDDDDGDGTRNFKDSDTTEPTTFETESSYAEWIDTSADAKGVQLRGTIENNGVSFQFDDVTGQSAGINAEFATAIQVTLGVAAGEENAALTAFMDAAKAANPVIESANPELVPGDDNDGGSNLTWLWILLGVLLALTVIGGIIFLVLKLVSGKKEEF